MENVVNQNGEENTRFGVYWSVCCGVEIVLAEGMTFPHCPNHPKLTTYWKSVADEKIPRAVDLTRITKKKDGDPAV